MQIDGVESPAASRLSTTGILVKKEEHANDKELTSRWETNAQELIRHGLQR